MGTYTPTIDTYIPIIIVFGVLIVIASIAWSFQRSSSILENWAASNGYRIVQKEYRNVARGPFFWTTARGQTVYRVVVEDRNGNTRTGWVRCGSWWLGLFSDDMDVRWDE
jgi:hypothetical protein